MELPFCHAVVMNGAMPKICPTHHSLLKSNCSFDWYWFDIMYFYGFNKEFYVAVCLCLSSIFSAFHHNRHGFRVLRLADLMDIRCGAILHENHLPGGGGTVASPTPSVVWWFTSALDMLEHCLLRCQRLWEARSIGFVLVLLCICLRNKNEKLCIIVW